MVKVCVPLMNFMSFFPHASQLNMFHWHVSDSQSFPLEVPGFEELSEKGAYSSEDVYTQEDVQSLVEYAAAACILSILVKYLILIYIQAWH